MATFSERLNIALQVRDMKPADLSRLAKINEGAISQYRKGAYKAKQQTLDRIAKALNVSIPWLMGVEEKPFDEIRPYGYKPEVTEEVYTSLEVTLLENYRKLNKEGQVIANNTVKGLTMVPQYTIKEKPVSIFERQDIAMAASGLTPTTDLSDHNKNVVAKHYNKGKQ